MFIFSQSDSTIYNTNAHPGAEGIFNPTKFTWTKRDKRLIPQSRILISFQNKGELYWATKIKEVYSGYHLSKLKEKTLS